MSAPLRPTAQDLNARTGGKPVAATWARTFCDVLTPQLSGISAAIIFLAKKLDEAGVS